MAIIKAEPQEMWSSEDKENPGAVCKTTFIGGIYTVSVTKGDKTLTEEFKAEYEPRFGMDVADSQSMMAIASRLSDQLKDASEETKPS